MNALMINESNIEQSLAFKHTQRRQVASAIFISIKASSQLPFVIIKMFSAPRLNCNTTQAISPAVLRFAKENVLYVQVSFYACYTFVVVQAA